MAQIGWLELFSGVAMLGAWIGAWALTGGACDVRLGRVMGAWTRTGATEGDDDVVATVDDVEKRILQSSFGV